MDKPVPNAQIQAIKADRYNIGHIAVLQAYVVDQVHKGYYDFEANVILLRLYQGNPSLRDDRTVTFILVKALMNLPACDFHLCLCLVPQTFQLKEPIRSLKTFYDLLEAAQFELFWNKLDTANEETKSLVNQIPGFRHAIIAYIVEIVQMTYQNLPASSARQMLNITNGNDDALNAIGTLDVATQIVTMPLSHANQFRPKTFKENISFDKMIPIINSLNNC